MLVRKETEHVWIITINRPHVRNAIDRPTATLLSRTILDFERDPNSRIAVLHGLGSVFCAGADLSAISRRDISRMPQIVPVTIPEESHVSAISQDSTGPMGFSRIVTSKPIIAAVNGYAVAGGLELACWCDLRVVESNAIMGVFCRRWGIPLMDGGTLRLSRLIGLSNALDMILTGRGVTAEEAKQMGLANRVVPPGQSLQEAIKLAKEISQFPQDCLRADRMSAYRAQGLAGSTHLANLQMEFLGGAPVVSQNQATEFIDSKKGRSGSFEYLKASL